MEIKPLFHLIPIKKEKIMENEEGQATSRRMISEVAELIILRIGGGESSGKKDSGLQENRFS